MPAPHLRLGGWWRGGAGGEKMTRFLFLENRGPLNLSSERPLPLAPTAFGRIPMRRRGSESFSRNKSLVLLNVRKPLATSHWFSFHRLIMAAGDEIADAVRIADVAHDKFAVLTRSLDVNVSKSQE